MAEENTANSAATRATRSDGVATKARILSVALVAFARHGYGHVGSKDICREAEVNPAAINYYFGSYDELYVEVMREAHQKIMQSDLLEAICAQDIDERQKVEALIDALVDNISQQQWYYGHLWLRESMSPNQALTGGYREFSVNKRRLIAQILADYLQLPLQHELVDYSFLTFFSPFMLFMLKQSSLADEYGDGIDQQRLAQHIRCYALAGLEAVKTQFLQQQGQA